MESPADRATHYRNEATELRTKAAKDSGSLFKVQLLNLAGQYDRLATKTENSGLSAAEAHAMAAIHAPSPAPVAPAHHDVAGRSLADRRRPAGAPRRPTAQVGVLT